MAWVWAAGDALFCTEWGVGVALDGGFSVRRFCERV